MKKKKESLKPKHKPSINTRNVVEL